MYRSLFQPTNSKKTDIDFLALLNARSKTYSIVVPTSALEIRKDNNIHVYVKAVDPNVVRACIRYFLMRFRSSAGPILPPKSQISTNNNNNNMEPDSRITVNTGLQHTQSGLETKAG